MAWDHMDDDAYIETYIDEEKERDIDDFGDEDDFARYINNNLTDKKIELVLKYYNKKMDEEETQYEDYFLEELSEKKLRNIIKKDNEEYDFVSWLAEERGSEYSKIRDIVEDIYGSIDGISGDDIIKQYGWYIKDDELITAYKDNETLYNKRSSIQENIQNNKEVQEKILESDEDSVIDLAKLFSEKRNNQYYNDEDDDIGGDYDFQKAYIKIFVKDSDDKDSTAKALKYLNDEFGLDRDIAEEYDGPDMWLVDADKYNM